MREIKFKGWDKISNRSVRIEQLDFLNQIILVNDGFDSYERRWGEINLRESTGLKDKNGNEIYENDILECSVVFISENTFISEVIFKEGMFGVINKLAMGGTSCPIKLWALECTIKGNIFENPELIK